MLRKKLQHQAWSDRSSASDRFPGFEWSGRGIRLFRFETRCRSITDRRVWLIGAMLSPTIWPAPNRDGAVAPAPAVARSVPRRAPANLLTLTRRYVGIVG